MSKKNNSPKDHEALARLVRDLSQLDRIPSPEWTGEHEMLSLVINDALNGIDITARYPAFYRELLARPALRQAFLDTLEIIEKEIDGTLVDLPKAVEPNLDFLSKPPVKEKIKTEGQRPWRIKWQRTVEQLQALFAPPHLAYRADPSLFDDPWFALLREDFTVGDVQYAVVLECSLEEDETQALSTFLDVAVTFQGLEKQKPFPLRATLHWGAYHESLTVADEGRVKLPEIPLEAVFDVDFEKVLADLDFVLEATS